MTYTFRCASCGCTWQKEMKMSEYKHPKWCEVCGSTNPPVVRVYDSFNITFKGDGFTKSVKENDE